MSSTRNHGRRLREGDAVQLERENGETLHGVVVQVKDDGVDVVLRGPIRAGEVLSVSQTVRDDARYTAVMEVVEAGPGRSRVRLVGDWKRVQMRQFVRVSVYGIRMDVRRDQPENESERDRDLRLQRHRQQQQAEERPPRLLDLSAGGLRFESRHEYQRGELVEIQFSLPQTGPLTVRGEIVRAQIAPEAATGQEQGASQYGLRFLGMDESVRVKIMTWVFAEQARRFREAKKRPDADD
jgi:hypothetical protein